jgi:hypothetical protein
MKIDSAFQAVSFSGALTFVIGGLVAYIQYKQIMTAILFVLIAIVCVLFWDGSRQK